MTSASTALAVTEMWQHRPGINRPMSLRMMPTNSPAKFSASACLNPPSAGAQAKLEMKRALKIIAALIAIVVVAFWAAKGANTAWTKNQISETKIDPVTELPYPVIKDKFVPGLDFSWWRINRRDTSRVRSAIYSYTTNQ